MITRSMLPHNDPPASPPPPPSFSGSSPPPEPPFSLSPESPHLPPSTDPEVLTARILDLESKLDQVLRAVRHPTAPSVPTSPKHVLVTPSARPFTNYRSSVFSGSETPETFLNDLDRHYRLNANFFISPDDSRRVDEARTAMTGAAAVWFDNLFYLARTQWHLGRPSSRSFVAYTCPPGDSKMSSTAFAHFD